MGRQVSFWHCISVAPVAYPELSASTRYGSVSVGRARVGTKVIAFFSAENAASSR